MEKELNIVIINDFDYIQGGASKVAIDTANLISENYNNINVYFFSGNHKDTNDLNDNIIKICTNQNESLKEKNKLIGFFNGLYNFKAKKDSAIEPLCKEFFHSELLLYNFGIQIIKRSSAFTPGIVSFFLSG